MHRAGAVKQHLVLRGVPHAGAECRPAGARVSSRLTLAGQEERHRISQLLHDDLQQILCGVETALSRIHHELQAEGHPYLAGGLDQARLWVGRAITTMRQLTVDLSPRSWKGWPMRWHGCSGR